MTNLDEYLLGEEKRLLEIENNRAIVQANKPIPDGTTKSGEISHHDFIAMRDHTSPCFEAHAVFVDIARRTRWLHVLDGISLRVHWWFLFIEPVISDYRLDMVYVPPLTKLRATICASPAIFFL